MAKVGTRVAAAARCSTSKPFPELNEFELHVLCDASEIEYGAVCDIMSLRYSVLTFWVNLASLHRRY